MGFGVSALSFSVSLLLHLSPEMSNGKANTQFWEHVSYPEC